MKLMITTLLLTGTLLICFSVQADDALDKYYDNSRQVLRDYDAGTQKRLDRSLDRIDKIGERYEAPVYSNPYGSEVY